MNVTVKDKKEEKKEAEAVAKILTPDERKRLLIEGIKKTAVPAFIGAGFALLFVLTADKIAGKPWYVVFLLVILVSYYIQRFLYPVINVRVKEFEAKDWLYVEFLTIIYMLVFWTLLLN